MHIMRWAAEMHSHLVWFALDFLDGAFEHDDEHGDEHEEKLKQIHLRFGKFVWASYTRFGP